MQITAGVARGHQLRVPVVTDLRPTKSIVRQAIFSILGDVEGVHVLDLYAGTGSLGIEALSRGADWAEFVDISREACLAIQINLKHSRLNGKAKIHHESADNFLLSCPQGQYELAFADPPYELNIDHTLAALVSKLKKEAAVVYLHSKDKYIPVIKGLDRRETRNYGGTGVTFLTRSLA